jgi:predicted small lipoprotein YifL
LNVRSKIIFQEISKKNHLYFYLKILIVFFLVISLFCCGKKGPPIPPDTPPLFPVTDVVAKLFDDNLLELTWTAQAGKGASVPDGFRIYRSKQSLVDPECPGCPDVFEMVSELTVAYSLWGWAEKRINYHETLEDGYIYRYKVIAYTNSGLTSEWSDTVEVVVE